MWRQTTWVLLVVLGCGLLFMSVFPIFAYMRFEEPWQTALVGLKGDHAACGYAVPVRGCCSEVSKGATVRLSAGL